jgi:hypothetical protein
MKIAVREETADRVQPDDLTWDDFTARRTAPETGEEPAGQPKLARNKRQEPSLSALLLQAIHLAGARRGRIPRAERIREATLLDVLTTTMRRAR